MQIEELRQQAERETADAAKTRRPSWAPALVLTGELLDLCHSLEWLAPDDKPVARLCYGRSLPIRESLARGSATILATSRYTAIGCAGSS